MLERKNRVELYGDGIGYVEEIEIGNDIIEYVCDVARTTRGGSEPKSYIGMFNRLKHESGDNAKGRPFEYVHVEIKEWMQDMIIDMKHVYFWNHKMVTNLRNLNFGELKATNFNIIRSNKVFKGKVPKFVYDHIRTHTQISWLSETVRVKDIGNVEFWNNEDAGLRRLSEYSIKNYKVAKRLGYRDEIAARELSSRRYVTFICSGLNDAEGFKHFILERTKKATQFQTRELAFGIKQLLKK